MRVSIIHLLVAVAGVIALPAPKMGLDPRADVEGVIRREVSPWSRALSYAEVDTLTKVMDLLFQKLVL